MKIRIRLVVMALFISTIALAEDAATTPKQVMVRALVGTINSLPRGDEHEGVIGIWDGSDASPEGFALCDGDPVYQGTSTFNDLARPTLVTLAGQPAAMTIGSGGTEFLEPVTGESGVYRLVVADEGPCISLECTADPKGDGTIRVRLELNVTALVKRDPVEGLNLDVGRPTFSKRTMEGDFLLPSGQWLIQRLYYSDESDECMVILLSAETYVPSDKETAADRN